MKRSSNSSAKAQQDSTSKSCDPDDVPMWFARTPEKMRLERLLPLLVTDSTDVFSTNTEWVTSLIMTYAIIMIVAFLYWNRVPLDAGDEDRCDKHFAMDTGLRMPFACSASLWWVLVHGSLGAFLSVFVVMQRQRGRILGQF